MKGSQLNSTVRNQPQTRDSITLPESLEALAPINSAERSDKTEARLKGSNLRQNFDDFEGRGQCSRENSGNSSTEEALQKRQSFIFCRFYHYLLSIGLFESVLDLFLHFRTKQDNLAAIFVY